MIRSALHAAIAAVVLAAAAGVGADDTAKASSVTSTPAAPGLTAVAQGARTGLALTTLDAEAALERSQAVIGQPVGDHVLLDRQQRPTPLAKYRGKPLLVNFIYTACFQVCPTTTKNLQKAVKNTVGMLGANRFNIVSIGFNQPFDSPQAMKTFATQY
ncbi:MAG: SCO family protein, partial [Sulfuritalea sp.]|nr:SCO family protein [Sulfuritalea sp.]